MTNAEVYLLLLRPSGAPVLGEAAGLMFQGQIELEGLEWELHNQEEERAAEMREKRFRKHADKLERSASTALRVQHAFEDQERDTQRAWQDFLEEFDTSRGQPVSQPDIDAKAKELASRLKEIGRDCRDEIDKLNGKKPSSREAKEKEEARRLKDKKQEKLQQEQYEELERNKNFEVRFEKRVDLATTQMLNSMKAGDIFPIGTITILQRSVNHFMTLVFNLRKVRLLDYELSADVSDTMTHVVERWTAEFGEMDWAYQNRGNIDGLGASPASGVKLATQGTARAFTMKKLGAPL